MKQQAKSTSDVRHFVWWYFSVCGIFTLQHKSNIKLCCDIFFDICHCCNLVCANIAIVAGTGFRNCTFIKVPESWVSWALVLWDTNWERLQTNQVHSQQQVTMCFMMASGHLSLTPWMRASVCPTPSSWKRNLTSKVKGQKISLFAQKFFELEMGSTFPPQCFEPLKPSQMFKTLWHFSYELWLFRHTIRGRQGQGSNCVHSCCWRRPHEASQRQEARKSCTGDG